jgi:hypothetical protein
MENAVWLELKFEADAISVIWAIFISYFKGIINVLMQSCILNFSFKGSCIKIKPFCWPLHADVKKMLS